MIIRLLLLTPFLFLLTGCTSQQPTSTDNQTLKIIEPPYKMLETLNEAIVYTGKELLNTNNDHNLSNKLILTSFVDLNKLDKTSSFGRVLSESMFNELHTKGFKVVDFRGQNAVSVNEDGEFHITRDVERLKDQIESTQYIVVGTYANFEYGSILINARIIDSISGDIISTARAVYRPKDCKTFDLCQEEPRENMMGKMIKEKALAPIPMIKDK